MAQNLINKIYDLQSKAVEESKKIIKSGINLAEKNVSFYILYIDEYSPDVVTIRVEEVTIENGELFFIGVDLYGNKYKVSEFDDLISFVGFDLYNAVYQTIE